MVADYSGAPPVAEPTVADQTKPPPFPPQADPYFRTRGGIRRMISSVTRLASIQARIILLQTKLTAKRILMASMLWAGAIVVGILTVIFLDIGIFKVLTDIAGMQPAWAYLIFAAFHLLIAGVLVMWAQSIFKKPLPGTAAAKEKSDES